MSQREISSATPKLERNDDAKDDLDSDSVSTNTSHKEFSGQIATTWNMVGGVGNSFNSQKYYREQDRDEDNQFYPNEFGRDNHKYLTLDGDEIKKQASKSGKCKIWALISIVALVILAIVFGVVFVTVFPKGLFNFC